MCGGDVRDRNLIFSTGNKRPSIEKKKKKIVSHGKENKNEKEKINTEKR